MLDFHNSLKIISANGNYSGPTSRMNAVCHIKCNLQR